MNDTLIQNLHLIPGVERFTFFFIGGLIGERRMQ